MEPIGNKIILSYIVPVYKVEQYIRLCLDSIFQQGLDEQEFEVILVNDGTPDRSIEVVRDIIEAHQCVTVVEQTNQGLSAARNTGLENASGQYVLFLDSDDMLVPNTVVPLLDSACAHEADLIVAGFVKMTSKEIERGVTPSVVDTKEVVKTGRELFLCDLNPRECYVWRTIYRKAFLDNQHLRFMPGIYFEDVPFTTECYLKAEKCIKSYQIFYVYRQREDSIVSSVNMQKLKDLNEVMACLWKMKETIDLDTAEKKQMMNVLFSTFSITIWYLTHDKRLFAHRKEYVADWRQRVPELRFTNGIKQRLVSQFFRYAPLLYIKLRSLSK